MSLATDLWNQNQSLAEACLHHPFVQGIADGSLAKAKYGHYVGQDAFFLHAFARAYSVCAAKAATFAHFELFHQLAGGVLEELKLHEGYAQQWGVVLAEVRPSPATRRYVDFLTATAWSQPIEVTTAAMLPCMRLYAYLGQTLARPGIPDHAYGDWIKTYSQSFFEDLAQQLETLLNPSDLGQKTSHDASVIAAIEDAYRYGMQCELDFFQSAWESASEWV